MSSFKNKKDEISELLSNITDQDFLLGLSNLTALYVKNEEQRPQINSMLKALTQEIEDARNEEAPCLEELMNRRNSQSFMDL